MTFISILLFHLVETDVRAYAAPPSVYISVNYANCDFNELKLKCCKMRTALEAGKVAFDQSKNVMYFKNERDAFKFS